MAGATERKGKMSWEELDNLKDNHDLLAAETRRTYANITATADIDSGTVTGQGTFDIDDSTKSWDVNEHANKVVELINTTDGDTEYLVVTSNTATKLVFDTDIDGGTYESYRILPTYLATEYNHVVAINVTDNDQAILLPAVASQNERKSMKIYIELAENGSHKVPIVCMGNDTIRGYKYVTLEHRFEGIDIFVHTWGANHWDILSITNVKRYSSGHTTGTIALGSTTYVPLFPTANMIVDVFKRFMRVERSGYTWMKYTSRVAATFVLEGNFSFAKVGAGTTVVNVTMRRKINETGVTEDITSREATFHITKDGYEEAHFMLIGKLEHGDEITLIVKRDTGTISLGPNSTIVIQEI